MDFCLNCRTGTSDPWLAFQRTYSMPYSSTSVTRKREGLGRNALLLLTLSAKLFQLLFFMRVYPTMRQFRLLMGLKHHAHLLRRLRKHASILAEALEPMMKHLWHNRKWLPRANEVVAIFGAGCYGCLDTSPVYTRRPKSRQW